MKPGSSNCAQATQVQWQRSSMPRRTSASSRKRRPSMNEQPLRPSLASLEDRASFVSRHIGPRAQAQQAMLREIGFASMDALIDAVVPPAIRLSEPLPLPPPKGEAEALEQLRQLAAKNRVRKSL